MKHLGDITKIRGDEAPAVDVVIGGSPCQDLSIAGKRAGLAGERSGLYMEQIRIIKEMRKRDELAGRTAQYVRPRYMVWENVPGAFSSNGGKDFAAVLEEAIRVVEPEAPDVPVPPKGWPTSGCIRDVLGNWSVAWRVLDAQFWGVPQRRRRIALVADFGGLSAPEILFVRQGVSRDIEPGEPKREKVAGDVGEGAGADDRAGEGFNGYNGDLTGVVSAALGVNCGVSTGRNGVIERRLDAVGFDAYTQAVTGTVAKTLTATASDADHIPIAVYGIDQMAVEETPVCRHIVRRLTPLECERLQGFPDGWTDIGEWVDSKGKKHKEADSPRYKALGNSIALPPWKWVLKRLCGCYERDATMASLFDGIGGFPYIWEQLNGKGSCLWASEIEEFPMAVTKLRFGGE